MVMRRCHLKVSGKNVVKELIKNNNKILNAYISDRFNDESIIGFLKSSKIKYEVVNKSKLDKMESGNHQGIIVEIEDHKESTLDEIMNCDNNRLIVLLDHIEDPHNFGAIIRTGEAADIGGIIIPKDRSVGVNSTVMKTSAGALPYINIVTVTNLVNTIKLLKKNGYFIVGTALDGIDYQKVDYDMKVCLIVGNEGNGMSRLVKEQCDFIVSLPMNGNINSLNASVATGIMIYKIIS